MSSKNFILKFSGPNKRGIVASIAAVLFKMDFNIVDAQQYNDETSDQFFARIEFDGVVSTTKDDVTALIAPVAAQFQMSYTVQDKSVLRRVLLLVSKFDHCLADLLYRWRTNELEMDIVGIISNHAPEFFAHLDISDIPFHYLPVTRETKSAQEAQIWEIVQQNKPDLIVLARYMQILSDDLSAKLSGNCINIHHSFLPSFKGAKPYHQAHARGVKIIGATAHYVTGDLDEGPIIEQDIERISHRDTPENLVRKGREIERRVLARAVRSHLEGRVLLNGTKTVVFPE
jgi:formyltetrahydrofolate deformylase